MPSVTVSTKGQIVIPKDIRDRIGLAPGDRVEVRLKGRTIELVPDDVDDRDVPADWRAWQGRFRGLSLLRHLRAERQKDAERDARLS
jgi:AbrB family looped-hinge helix DNA binding protein